MLAQLLELRETLRPTGYLKETIKNTDEEPDEELHGWGGRVSEGPERQYL